MRKKLLSLFMAFALGAGSLTAGVFGGAENVAAQELPEVATIVSEANANAEKLGVKKGTDWTVSIYLCGTDLEMNGGAAGEDLVEMLKANIPEGVNVLALTGATPEWNDQDYEGFVKPSGEKTQIWQITDKKMNLIYEYDAYKNFAEPDLIENFLRFSADYAPASHTMVSFWNHGGGPIDGAELALNSDGTRGGTLSLKQIEDAVKNSNEYRKQSGDTDAKYDIVGFDCCLMGNLEIAYAFKDSADYFLGSEEVEPNHGWNYEWMNVFSTPGFSEKTCAEQCEAIGTSEINYYPHGETEESSKADWLGTDQTTLTMALVDLSKIDGVVEAVNDMAREMQKIYDDDDNSAYSDLSRAVQGTRSLYDGSVGLVDIYILANAIKDAAINDKLTAAADKVIATTGKGQAADGKGYVGTPEQLDGAVSPCVLYYGLVQDHCGGNGLSIFFPVHYEVDKSYLSAASEADGVYQNLSVAAAMPDYMSFVKTLASRTDESKDFKGTVVADVDYENAVFYAEAKDGDPATISSAEASFVIDDGGTMYLMGDKKATFNEERNRYETPELFTWKSIDGTTFTYSEEYLVNQIIMKIPVVDETTDGEKGKYKTGDVVPEEELKNLLVMQIEDKYAIVGVLLPGSEQSAERAEELDVTKDYSFRTVKARVDDGKYIANEIATASPEAVGTGKLQVINIGSSAPSTSAVYETYVIFKLYDMNNKEHTAEPVAAIEISLDKLVLKKIKDQVYTEGTESEPELLFTVEDYEEIEWSLSDVEDIYAAQSTVEYTDNTAPGTGHVKVTLTGKTTGEVLKTLEADFNIITEADIKTEEKELTNTDKSVSKVTVKTMPDGSGTIEEVRTMKNGTVYTITSDFEANKAITNTVVQYKDSKKKDVCAQYKLSEESFSLVSFTTTGKTAVVPETVDLYDPDFKPLSVLVDGIETGAFAETKGIKSVELSGKLTSVGEYAFTGVKKKATFKIYGTKKEFKNVKKLVKNSGMKKAKFKRVK